MVNLNKRSYEKELLDQPDVSFDDIKKNMQELNAINRLLGGHSITLDGFRHFTAQIKNERPLVICEIGCGGGDNLFVLAEYCQRNNIACTFIGIDLKQECIDFAAIQYPGLAARWIRSDYREISFKADAQPDIIFSSLFCHHFTNDQLSLQLQWMRTNSRKGFFINDLHRHVVAYYSIKWITGLFSGSYLVKHDAALSVARGFHRTDWLNIINSAGIAVTHMRWRWAFRWLLVFQHG